MSRGKEEFESVQSMRGEEGTYDGMSDVHEIETSQDLLLFEGVFQESLAYT